MTKLEKLIELNNLEKQNRRNRLDDKLKQQEYYGEIEELFDPLTKTISENNERNLAFWSPLTFHQSAKQFHPSAKQFH